MASALPWDLPFVHSAAGVAYLRQGHVLMVLMRNKEERKWNATLGLPSGSIARPPTHKKSPFFGQDPSVPGYAEAAALHEKEAKNAFETAKREWLEETGGCLGEITEDRVKVVLKNNAWERWLQQGGTGTPFLVPTFVVVDDGDPEVPREFSPNKEIEALIWVPLKSIFGDVDLSPQSKFHESVVAKDENWPVVGFPPVASYVARTLALGINLLLSAAEQ